METEDDARTTHSTDLKGSGLSRVWGQRITALVCIALSLYFWNMAREFPAGGGIFPIFTALGTIVLSLFMIAATFIGAGRNLSGRTHLDLSYSNLKPPILVLLTVVYILAIFEIGYFTASVLFLFLSTALVGIRKFRAVILTGLILFPLMYIFFVVLLQARLPEGILF